MTTDHDDTGLADTGRPTSSQWLAELQAGLTDLYRTWRNPPPELIAKVQAGGGFQADYLSHADTTRALLEADPLWTLEPAVVDEASGGPVIVRKDGRLVSWWRLTVLGHERLCVGTCADNKAEPEKELIGDAIRNGAMRFGVALALWSKAEWADTPTPRPSSSAEDGRRKALSDALLGAVKALDEDTRAAFRTIVDGAGLPDRTSAMTVPQLEEATALLAELQEADK